MFGTIPHFQVKIIKTRLGLIKRITLLSLQITKNLSKVIFLSFFPQQGAINDQNYLYVSTEKWRKGITKKVTT